MIPWHGRTAIISNKQMIMDPEPAHVSGSNTVGQRSLSA